MKQTYKLLGIEWDHAPLPAECPVFIPNQEIQDWRKDRNLFDLEEYQRSITISEIMAANSLDALVPFLKSVKGCDQVIIMLDYEPKTHAPDVVSFFALRVLQMYEYVRQRLYGVPVYLMGSDQMKDYFDKLMASRVNSETEAGGCVSAKYGKYPVE